MCKCGGMPTLFQLQVQYYPVRPDVGGPKWNISAASDADDPGPHQEGALLTAAEASCTDPGSNSDCAGGSDRGGRGEQLEARVQLMSTTLESNIQIRVGHPRTGVGGCWRRDCPLT